MKLIDILNEVILKEKYGEITPFYHLADKDSLDSLLKGIQVDVSTDRGQGKGFYVSNDLKIIEGFKIRQIGAGVKPGGLIIEIQAIFNEENFDIDIELTKNRPDIIKKIKPQLESKFKHFTIEDPKNNAYKFEVFVDGEGDKEDFEIEMMDDEMGGTFFSPKPKSGKNIKYGFIPITFIQDSGTVGSIKSSIDSLDTIGVKNTIENQIYNTILDNPLYLRYVGPPIKPTRYKLQDDSGKWGEWVNV
jgi:hypothetical protein